MHPNAFSVRCYHETSNISHSLVGKIFFDHSDELEHHLSALLQLHLHSRFNSWLQWFRERQLQDKTRNIKVYRFGAIIVSSMIRPHKLIFTSPTMEVFFSLIMFLKLLSVLLQTFYLRDKAWIDPSHKSHNVLGKYPTMHHLVTKMCIHVHISVTKWCIVVYGTVALWDLWDDLIALLSESCLQIYA